jgi:hypothetical protein
MITHKYLTVVCLAVALIAISLTSAFGQQPPPQVENENHATSKETIAGSNNTAPAPPPAQEVSEGKLSRWFDFQIATLGVRYRFIDNSLGVVTSNQMQHAETFRGRFKFDRLGKYNITAHVASGNTFLGAWNNTGVGSGSALTNVYLKQLFFTAKPTERVEVQYGGIGVARGESTEITTYDSDAYLVGERLMVKLPKKLFFGDVTVTYAFLGDLLTPSFTKRWRRLGESNYHQFLLGKTLGNRAALSVDYTSQSGIDTMHQAVRFSIKESRVLDTTRFEVYERTGAHRDWGFAISGEKTMFKRLTLGGGYSQIDRDYGGLNGDRYNRGKMIFFSSNFVLSPEFSFQTFVGQGLPNDYATPNRTRVDLIMSYNLLKTLKRTGLF